jgi:hypothetical protein
VSKFAPREAQAEVILTSDFAPQVIPILLGQLLHHFEPVRILCNERRLLEQSCMVLESISDTEIGSIFAENSLGKVLQRVRNPIPREKFTSRK